jgi:hypothetical protein
MIFIEKASQPAEEIQFLESLLDITDDAQLEKTLRDNSEKINQDFLNLLNSVITQSEGQNTNPQVTERLQKIYKVAMRISMEINLSK